MDGTILAQRCFEQFGAIALEIAGLEETWLPVVAALDDMLRHVQRKGVGFIFDDE
jgi:hypothetical protein